MRTWKSEGPNSNVRRKSSWRSIRPLERKQPRKEMATVPKFESHIISTCWACHSALCVHFNCPECGPCRKCVEMYERIARARADLPVTLKLATVRLKANDLAHLKTPNEL